MQNKSGLNEPQKEMAPELMINTKQLQGSRTKVIQKPKILTGIDTKVANGENQMQITQKEGETLHYDPESALANRTRQRRLAPVQQTIKGLNGAKLATRGGAQPTQQKKQAKNQVGANSNTDPDLRIRGTRSQSYNHNNVVKSSELEALRNYNAQMNFQLKQRDQQQDTHPDPISQPTVFAKNTFGQASFQQPGDQNQIQPHTLDQADNYNQQFIEQSQDRLENNKNQNNRFIIDENATKITQNNFSINSAAQIQNQIRQPISSVVNPGHSIYKYGQDRDKHQHAIIGSSSLAAHQPETNPDALLQEKELKQKEYQIELQRQIKERDFIRKKEEYRKTKGFDTGQNATHSQLSPIISANIDPQTKLISEMPYLQSESPINNQLKRSLSGRAQQSKQTQHYENTNDFDASGNNKFDNQINNFQQFDPQRTKLDFPDIKTRGKVLENRTDLELERQGNILTLGRDEKTIFQSKREQEQAAMRQALQQQIEEKQRKKEIEKEKSRQYELRDDQRVRDEMKQMAIAEGIAPSEPTSAHIAPSNDLDSSLKIQKESSNPLNPNLMASHGANSQYLGLVHGSRRTAYAANQHSVSIIGSDIGHQYLPENLHHIAQNKPVQNQLKKEETNNHENNDNPFYSSLNQYKNETQDDHPKNYNQIHSNNDLTRISTTMSPNNQKQSWFKDNKNQQIIAVQNQYSNQSPLAKNISQQNKGIDLVEGYQKNINAQQDGLTFADNINDREQVLVDDHKDKQINELSDMVKELLKEQKELKYQLDATNQERQKHKLNYKPSKYSGPIKRASERVPRSVNQNLQSNDPIKGINLNNDIDFENPRNNLNIGLSSKPNGGDPESNVRLNAERKKMSDIIRKQQQDKQKEKIDAIEAKIQNARKRLEEKKKIKSDNAKNTVRRRIGPSSSQYKYHIQQSDTDWNEEGAITLQAEKDISEPGLYISSKSQNSVPRVSNVSQNYRDHGQQSKVNVQRSISINKKTISGSASHVKNSEFKQKKRVQLNLQNNQPSTNSLKQPHQRPTPYQSTNLEMVQIESPGKFSQKPHHHEKELDHESHLIHNQPNSQQHNNIPTSSSNIQNTNDESIQNKELHDNNYLNPGGQSDQSNIIGRASRNHQNIQESTGLSINQHKAQMLSQQIFIPKHQQTGFREEGPKSYNFGGKQSNTVFGETSFDMEFMMPPDITSIDSDINKIGALTPSPFIDGPIDNFNLTSTNTALNSNFVANYPQKLFNAQQNNLNQAVSQGYRRGDRGSFGAQAAGSHYQKGGIAIGALSAFSGHQTTNEHNKLGGPLITNYTLNQNPAAVTQNAGFQNQTDSDLDINMRAGIRGAAAYNNQQLDYKGIVGPNAPSSVQFGFHESVPGSSTQALSMKDNNLQNGTNIPQLIKGDSISPQNAHLISQQQIYNPQQQQQNYDPSKYIRHPPAHTAQLIAQSSHQNNYLPQQNTHQIQNSDNAFQGLF